MGMAHAQIGAALDTFIQSLGNSVTDAVYPADTSFAIVAMCACASIQRICSWGHNRRTSQTVKRGTEQLKANATASQNSRPIKCEQCGLNMYAVGTAGMRALLENTT